MENVLTIAGSDSCGGAGIQADLKTFSAHGVYGMSVITAVTAQNTLGVSNVENIKPSMVADQIDALFEDIPISAIKIGMVSETSIIVTIAESLSKHNARNIILDPVMISKSGCDLLHPEAKQALIDKLIPMSDLITPNIPEAEVILNRKIECIDDMIDASKDIYKLGAKNVLIKGGHLNDEATDILFDGDRVFMYEGKRIPTKNTHGTGCTLSSAIASNIALGYSMTDAVEKAKHYIHTAITYSFNIGKGVGPTHHFYELYRKAGMI